MSRLLARNHAIVTRPLRSRDSRIFSLNQAQFTTAPAAQSEGSSLLSKPNPKDKTPKKTVFRYTAGKYAAARRKLLVVDSRPNPLSKQPKVSTESATSSASTSEIMDKDSDIAAMLSRPTWSVRSLLPPKSPTQTITRTQLHHLLRLSALPLPKDSVEEKKMLQSLHSQLHFVGDIQKVDTEGVEPLVRIAEETEAGMKEATIGLEELKDVLDREVVTGRNKRRRRARVEVAAGEGEDWDVFKTATETVEVPGSGRYFVVRSGKGELGD